ncbi:MAG: hypothetical protein PHH86_04735, partial [Sphaerochaetaceae bacterium]|nr:hypothetical protein [Sphaerochaetaceae bacterium]
MPSGLLLNLQANDIVIDSNLLRFSWIEDLSQMEMQSTYRIEMRLFGHQGWVLWWDSGNVKSSNSAQVEYNGPDLLSRSLYDWRVSTSKDGTHWSDWSERQSFFSGTFGNWHAKPIWASNDTDTVFFRYEVSLDISKKIKTARWLVTGRDTAPSRQYVFQIFIDGELVGVGPSRGYDSILPYSSFDVTDVLEKRSNICLSAICFSRGKNADFSSELLVFYDDGTSKTVVTDNKWSVLNAKDIVGMGASYHHFYDVGPENWNLANEPRNWKYSG